MFLLTYILNLQIKHSTKYLFFISINTLSLTVTTLRFIYPCYLPFQGTVFYVFLFLVPCNLIKQIGTSRFSFLFRFAYYISHYLFCIRTYYELPESPEFRQPQAFTYLCTSKDELFISLLIWSTLVILVSPLIACFITDDATAKLTVS